MKRRGFCKGATLASATFLAPTATSAVLNTSTSGIQSMNDHITALSASRLSSMIRAREVSCVEVISAYLERIHQYNPVYNAIISLADEAATSYLEQRPALVTSL